MHSETGSITLQAPASKSVSHRMLIGAALAEGVCVVERVLESRDLERTMAILHSAGVQIERVLPGTYRVGGVGGARGGLRGGTPLSCDVHESGTTCRLLTAVLATGQGAFRLHGAPRMHERPIGELTAALETLGVHVTFEGKNGYPPFVLHTDGLSGGVCTLGLSESSQYLSGLLLAAPLAKAELLVNIGGDKVVSWPYVGLTLQTLEDFGIPFVVEQAFPPADTPPPDRALVVGNQPVAAKASVWQAVNWRTLDEARPGELRFRMQPATYRAGSQVVEGDWSGASYFLAAGAVGRSPVRVEGLRADSLQGDRFMLTILRDMGARVEVEANAVTVYPSALHGVCVDMGRCPDLVPTVAVLAAYASGATTVRNVAHLRIKESDRIAAPAHELAKVGVCAHEHADGLTVDGLACAGRAPNFSALLATQRFSAHGDHRIAMSLALLELEGGRLHLDDPACVGKSFPDFWEHWAKLRRGVSA